jgi:hypothetical protein
VTEERLVSVLPPKEKKRYAALSHKVTPSEIVDAENDLLSWNKKVAEKETTLLGSQRSSGSGRLPPVRGSGAAQNKDTATAPSTDLSEIRAANADILALLNANQGKKFEKLCVELDVGALSDVKRQYKAGTPPKCNNSVPLCI